MDINNTCFAVQQDLIVITCNLGIRSLENIYFKDYQRVRFMAGISAVAITMIKFILNLKERGHRNR